MPVPAEVIAAAASEIRALVPSNGLAFPVEQAIGRLPIRVVANPQLSPMLPYVVFLRRGHLTIHVHAALDRPQQRYALARALGEVVLFRGPERAAEGLPDNPLPECYLHAAHLFAGELLAPLWAVTETPLPGFCPHRGLGRPPLPSECNGVKCPGREVCLLATARHLELPIDLALERELAWEAADDTAVRHR